MKPQKEILEYGKEKLGQLKTIFDELEVQLALGKAEARDAFEREKKNLSRFINQQKVQLEKAEKVADEKLQTLLHEFEALEAKLSADVPKSKRKYDKYKDETLQCIYSLEYNLKESYGEVSSTMREQLDHFKTKLDGYRIQLALSGYDKENELERRRDELKEKVAELRDRLQKEEEKGTRLDSFVDEISTSFDHLKRAFSDLFS